jgi:hypothetical protein
LERRGVLQRQEILPNASCQNNIAVAHLSTPKLALKGRSVGAIMIW